MNTSRLLAGILFFTGLLHSALLFGASPQTGVTQQHPVRWTSGIKVKDLTRLDRAIQAPVDMSHSGGSLECFPNEETGETADCKSCADYFKWIEDGGSTENTYQISMESWFKNACLPLKFLQQAKPSGDSYWNDFNLKTIPLPELDPLIAVVADGSGWKRTVKGEVIMLESENDVVSIEQMAWGDFDGDGIEDSLFYLTYNVVEGTLRYYTDVVVTRKSKDGPLQILTELK